MTVQPSPDYVALVAALRANFDPLAMEALNVHFGPLRNSMVGVLHTLAKAVHDAADITFDAGETVHPAVRAFLAKVRAGESPWPTDSEAAALSAQLCTHGADCPVHPNADALHNCDTPGGDQ